MLSRSLFTTPWPVACQTLSLGILQARILEWVAIAFSKYMCCYLMRNAGLEETQAGIKIARRNINNLRYADDTIFMTESEEELESLLIK